MANGTKRVPDPAILELARIIAQQAAREAFERRANPVPEHSKMPPRRLPPSFEG